MDPIHQFALHPVVSIQVAGHDVSLTNSGLYMLLAVALACLLVALGARGGSGVPGRMQAMAEMAYEFIAGMVRSAAGEAGMRFFPLVFCIFFFIVICNLIGIIPYSFTVTSQIIITAAFALLVFFTVVIVGIKDHGLHFFKVFVPPDVPIYILPLVVAIEIFSFFVRPVSHSVRLFANMLAGHITLNVFGSFVVMLLGAGALFKAFAVLPFLMTIGLFALELLVAFLQAYVFAMLTCMYLNDALHPGGH
ncbi:F0F1 ATP synthase subunit A [Roseiarcus sp.]|uniref:F0F1 ATP synthase subunit A n=1 Tax=Roseiarcus sp. TaxID=1969460 RepID=UPI003D0A5F5B